MISFAEPLPVGNAVRVMMSPPAGATQWTLLRKLTDDISGPTDANAAVIYAGDTDTSVLDAATLVNGTPYYYREFDLVNGSWVGSPSVSVTPSAAGLDAGPDVLSLVRDRLEQALKARVASGFLVNSLGYIPVLTAPPIFDQVKFPIVTVHLRSDSPEVRGIGEMVAPDLWDDINNDWIASEGWLSRVALDVTGWALNPDERLALRKAMKAAIIGNLPVFYAYGLDLVEASFNDQDEFESFGAPMYTVQGTFSCLAPSVLYATKSEVITDISAAASATPQTYY